MPPKNDNSEKKSFIFYKSYLNKMQRLGGDKTLILLKAMVDYTECGQEPDFNNDESLRWCFDFIKDNLDRDNEKWLARKAQNSEAGKRSAEARKAGAATDSIHSSTHINNSDNINYWERSQRRKAEKDGYSSINYDYDKW